VKKIKAFVEVTRGDRVESIHHAEISVFDREGREVFGTENTGRKTYLRSSAKPFQATVLLDTKTDQFFGIPEAWIALTCASHNGEEIHADIVRAFLQKIGLDDSALQCGTHVPLVHTFGDGSEQIRESYSPVYHNCSGKHTGMLAVCRHLEEEVQTYLHFDHPVQKMILKKIEAYSEEKAIHLALDGCTAPVFYISVQGMSRMYRHLACGSDESLGKIWKIMTENSYLIAGKGRFDTQIMEICNGKIAAKVGAEGVQGCAVRLPDGRRFGINIKILDGNRRALASLLIETLLYLEALTDTEIELLKPFHRPELKNYAGRSVGEIRAIFENI
jgi:L-asparaginase II